MDVLDSADGLEKVPQVVTFGESCELRNIIQAHIHQAFHSSPAEFREKSSADFFVNPIVHTAIEKDLPIQTNQHIFRGRSWKKLTPFYILTRIKTLGLS